MDVPHEILWTGLAVLAVGVAIVVLAYRMGRPLEDYEFYNRSEGGVVSFESPSHARRHQMKKGLVRLITMAGGTLVMIGAVVAAAIGALLMSTN